MRELQWLTASEIGAAYAARRLSPVELVRALLREIEAHNSDCGAFIRVDAEGALETARRAEADIFAGRSLGPLHGIPLGAKDNIDIAGGPTTCHSKILLDNVARADAPAIANLRAAGAIMLGKQSLHEFAFGGPSKELPFPFARHPWNTDYHPGGSSSGSGVALAAGFVPLSLGTDAGGSIRNPAGCGVVGLEADLRSGVAPRRLSGRLHARSCRADGALGRRRGAVPGRACRILYGAQLRRRSRARRARFADRLRTAMARNRHGRRSGGHGGARRGRARARQDGAEVRTIALPRLQELAAVQRIILLAETWAVHAKWLRERPQDYSTPCRRKVMPGAFLSAGDYVLAQQWRGRMIDAVDDAFRDVDVLLTASGMDPPFRIDDGPGLANLSPPGPQPLQSHRASSDCDAERHFEYVRVAIIGAVRRRRAHDEVTLRVAAAYERVTQWRHRRPPAMYRGGSQRERITVTA